VSGVRAPFAWKDVVPTQVNSPGGDLRPPWADQPHVRLDHARRSTRDRGRQVAQQAVGDVPGYGRRPAAQVCLLPSVAACSLAPDHCQGPQRIGLTSSPSRRRMAGLCAFQPKTGIGVELNLSPSPRGTAAVCADRHRPVPHPARLKSPTAARPRVPHILDNDYSPKSAFDIFTKDLGTVSTWPGPRPFRCRLRLLRCRCLS
jgi:hypothetical protein